MNPVLRQELLNEFDYVTFNDQGSSLSGNELVNFLQGHDGAIIALEVISRDILAALPNLKVIGKYGVGLDKLDLQAMEDQGVRLGWTPGVNAQAVAELTLGLALNIIRKIPQGYRSVQDGRWQQIKGRQLSSLTFGLIGCGHVGKAVVNLLKPFGCQILVNDIEDYADFYLKNELERVSLESLISQSDVVSLHVPLNDSTRLMINERAVGLFKPGSYLINTARGGLVDECAALRALNSGRLAAAAFDVLEIEPPVSADLIQHPNVFVTPHIAGSSEEAILAMGRAAIKGLSNHQPAGAFSKYQ